MPITEILPRLQDRIRALGTRWWKPPQLIPLFEVIRTADTCEPMMVAVMEFRAAAGKTPVRVEKDVPGSIGNRLQHALWQRQFRWLNAGFAMRRQWMR